MTRNPLNRQTEGKGLQRSALFYLSFIVAFEIAIMISPFAFFFYAAFNPFLLALNQSWMTRWLTPFFLPHMVVPPNEALTIFRILGSVFFVGGDADISRLRWTGLHGQVIEEAVSQQKDCIPLFAIPNISDLGMAALGLAIMWPRFLTLTLFAVMLFLYYLLAKDEERRMISRFGDSYIAYINRTGMFLPHFIERAFIGNPKPQQRLSIGKAIVIFLVLLVITVGSGFILRAYTVHHLPLEQVNGIDVITITKEDLTRAEQLLPSALQNPAIASKLQLMENNKGHRLLAYFIPIDYVMQGMIANTGEEWKLFEQHKTIGMITEYIFHPFAHLTEGHAHQPGMQAHNLSMHDSPSMKRRIIFIELSAGNKDLTSPFDDFDINITRKPLFFVDIHLHTGEILQIRDTPAGSGWGTVPTPMF